MDAIYMSAVQMMTGQGGWPMTVFLTPDGKPFYGGTYFPPQDMYGRPGFPRILEAVAAPGRRERMGIEAQGDTILAQLDKGNDLTRDLPDSLLTPAVLENAYNNRFRIVRPDVRRLRHRSQVSAARQSGFSAPLSCPQQAAGTAGDGGKNAAEDGDRRHVRSTGRRLPPLQHGSDLAGAALREDAVRQRPTGADLCPRLAGDGQAFYKGVAEETLEYVLREMTSAEGGFYSAQDADSEGEEGKFFVWTPEEIKAVLGEREARGIQRVLRCHAGGNWEGKQHSARRHGRAATWRSSSA